MIGARIILYHLLGQLLFWSPLECWTQISPKPPGPRNTRNIPLGVPPLGTHNYPTTRLKDQKIRRSPTCPNSGSIWTPGRTAACRTAIVLFSAIQNRLKIPPHSQSYLSHHQHLIQNGGRPRIGRSSSRRNPSSRKLQAP